MKTSTRVGAYAVALATVFAAALGAGRAVGPVSSPVEHPTTHPGGSAGHDEQAPGPPAGLQVTQDGYHLRPLTASVTPGVVGEFAFRILGPDGTPVTRYTPTHDRNLHLIVVRRDLAGFQHLHPRLDGDGTWRVALTVPAAGQYRFFADFRPADRAQALTLGVDVPAPGGYAPTPLPAVSRTATVDGYTVDLTGDLTAGTASRLTLRVSRDGRPVTDLQPYLGAYGHLVALRDGDLAYLHVHPDGAPGDGRTAAGPQVTFFAEVPSVGTYRLYLDFQHDGAVRTAEFTAATTGVTAVPSQPAPPSPAGHGDHGSHD
jgi:hypothetical protein